MFPVLVAALGFSLFSAPASVLEKIGTDIVSYPGTEAGTAVGPVLGTNGLAEVAIYQTNRYYGDAAAAMAYSTSYDGGITWSEGLLPGLTKATNANNPWDRVTFETIAYNQKYHEFLVSVLPISNTPSYGDSDTTESPEVLHSVDGFNWSTPVAIESGAIRPEKNYIACDNFTSSPHYGTCYVTWDDNDNNDEFHVNVSTDGGNTWSPTISAPDGHSAYGALPVIQPNGNVVVTSEDSNGYDGTAQNIISFVSSNGGASFSPGIEISPLSTEAPAGGNMRSQALPTSGVDAYGNVYTIWQDCRFRSGCSSNDLVESTSSNGVNWSPVSRIALDPVTSGADHFLPTLSILNSFFGSTLSLSYYGFPQANCSVATCALTAYETSSSNNGASWSTPLAIAGPFNLTSLASTSAGYMVGDYFQGIYRFGFLTYEAPLAVATAPVNGVLNETVGLSLPTGNLYSLFARTRHVNVTGASAKRFVPHGLAMRRAPLVHIHKSHHPM